MRRCLLTLTLALVACKADAEPTVVELPAVEHGRFLFGDPSASPSPQNAFSCASCHRAAADAADERILPGAALAGAPERPSYWGGAELELLGAINHCRTLFMAAQKPWTADDEEAKVMYLYLMSLAGGDGAAQPFTLVAAADDLAAGDPGRGGEIYRRSCAACHGEAHTGAGRLRGSIPVLPEESVAYFESLEFDQEDVRVSFIEKVRHGPFLGLYGFMPLYSREALSDADLGALIAFLGLYPE
jgi:thiosulfate dehydrogenase